MVTSKLIYYPEGENIGELRGFTTEDAAIKFELYESIAVLVREEKPDSISGIVEFIIGNFDVLEKEVKKDRRSTNRFVQTSIVAPVHKPASIKK